MSNYQIVRGDTLSALAARYHTSVSALAKANHIANPDLIYAGASLQIPGYDGKDSFDSGARSGARSSSGAPVSASSVGKGGTAQMQRLASAARAAAMGMGGYNSQGLCATGVSRAIASAMGLSVHGNGNQIDNNLPRSKFKQVNMPLSEALKIPGMVLTWEKTSTRLGSIYGHTAITLGDGHSSASDFIENNTLAGNASRTGLKIFMPI
jgi:LysM repeat protein